MEIIFPETQINYEALKNAKSLFPKNFNRKAIYHYTSTDGLHGILSNQKLRFTNILYMNDREEIIAGLDSFKKVNRLSNEEHEKLQAAFVNRKLQVFVCCFSLEEDSLPMWNYYTKEVNNQGYNIEFDDKKLVESILRSNPCLDGCGIAFGKVEYSENNDSGYSIAVANEIMASFKLLELQFLRLLAGSSRRNIPSETIEELEKSISDIERKKINMPIHFYNGKKCCFEKNPSENYLYFIKRNCFKHEREFRIVITVPEDRLCEMDEKVYKFRVSNGVLVPYLELDFSKEVVKSLTISPTIKSDLVEQSMQDFVKRSKYNVENFSRFIKHSNIPVRF